ncbi:MAG: hypothetical protein GY749_21000 [Desulfobacteraceae bacterium]|nr:hypothetical protein [Desulfobacteraceae bacterium]
MHGKKYFLTTLLFLSFLSSISWAAQNDSPPTIPVVISGSVVEVRVEFVKTDIGPGKVTEINDIQLTRNSDKYVFVVTTKNGLDYSPEAKDSDGIDASNGLYDLQIPTYKKDDQSVAATPGDIAIMHVYKNGRELEVVSPYEGRITVGEQGDNIEVNLIVVDKPDIILYTKEEVESAVEEGIREWDVNSDGKIGIEEAINALRVISGF